VSTGQLALAAGVTAPAIDYARKQGRIEAVVRNNRYRFNLDTELSKFLTTSVRRGVAVAKGYDDGEDAPDSKDGDGITDTNAAVRERVYKARKAKLDYLERRGELIPSDAVLREWQAIAQGVQSRLLSIPDRVSTMVEGLKHREIHRVLTDEIRDALATLSDSITPGT
jgi:phage terminase Nu1 subunit (DNA packaging protein)